MSTSGKTFDYPYGGDVKQKLEPLKNPHEQIQHVLAFSGGIDSTSLLATRPITLCVFVDYGQPAVEAERRACRHLAARFEVPLREVHVEGLHLGEMTDETGKPGMRVVPARNAVIASICANLTPAPGGYVYFGAHAEDEPYPDCRASFFDFLSLVLANTYQVHVLAPNLAKSKAEVVSALAEILREYDFACWSCYTPRSGRGDMLEPCETCNSCLQRAEAAKV